MQTEERTLFDDEGGTAVHPMRPGYLYYRCVGIEEEDSNFGWFTGEVDWTGKYTFQPSGELGHGAPLYLFPVEVVEFGPLS